MNLILDGFFNNDVLECYVNASWVKVSSWIFRSWTGNRKVNGKSYNGPVFVLGTNDLPDNK